MSRLLPKQTFAWSDAHIETIKGTGGDYDGQVAYNCTILKGRVKRGPGKGRPTFRVVNYFDLEAFGKVWNQTRNKAFPMAMAVTDGGLGAIKDLAESLRPQPLTAEKMNALRSPGRRIHVDSGEVGVVKKESTVLTDEEFLAFLKGDMVGAKLVAYDKDGKEFDPMSIDPLMVASRSHDQDLLNEYLEANGGMTDVHAINKPKVAPADLSKEGSKFTDLYGGKGVISDE